MEITVATRCRSKRGGIPFHMDRLNPTTLFGALRRGRFTDETISEAPFTLEDEVEQFGEH